MAKENFDRAVAFVLRHEGGYVNHPSDPGGPTNFGITLATFRRFAKEDARAADLKAMTAAVAKRIYKSQYWDALRCDALPSGVDYAVFDYGVNSGVGRAGRVLRTCLGLPASTHAVTAEVIAAVHARDPSALTAAICDERIAFLKRLRTWPVFGRGWERRVAEVRAASLVFAREAPARPERRGLAALLAFLRDIFRQLASRASARQGG